MSERKPISYTIARFDKIAPGEVLTKSCGKRLDAALIFSPDACRIARIDGSSFIVVDDREEQQEDDLTHAYEVRAFGPEAELRWIRDGAMGNATLLADGSVNGAPVTGETLDVLSRTYRIWGEPARSAGGEQSRRIPGWSKLTTARIGALFVPFETAGEVTLHAREYVVGHETGNAVVLFERLVGFDAAPA